MAQGSLKGVDEISPNIYLTPLKFEYGIRIINSPFSTFTDSIPKQLLNDLAEGFINLAMTDENQTEYL